MPSDVFGAIFVVVGGKTAFFRTGMRVDLVGASPTNPPGRINPILAIGLFMGCSWGDLPAIPGVSHVAEGGNVFFFEGEEQGGSRRHGAYREKFYERSLVNHTKRIARYIYLRFNRIFM